MFYFIDSLFKRKSVLKLMQVSIKVFKITYFSFSFKLKEKKKVPLKNMVWREWVTRKYLIKRGGVVL